MSASHVETVYLHHSLQKKSTIILTQTDNYLESGEKAVESNQEAKKIRYL